MCVCVYIYIYIYIFTSKEIKQDRNICHITVEIIDEERRT